jgi:host factor-I protein
MTAESTNIQDMFLNQLRKDREQVMIATTSGFKFKGRIKGFDRFSILVESGENEQIVFKHAIATISVKRGFSNKLKINAASPNDTTRENRTDQEERE